MIRKQVNFKVGGSEIITYNYQHDILRNIYRLIQQVDETKAVRMHNKGFRVETGHVYKLFNYTLLFEKAEFRKEGILCNKETIIKLVLSGKKDIIESILQGFIITPQLQIGETVFLLDKVEPDKKIRLKEVTLYKALSPIVVTTKTEGKVEYLTPYNPKYFENLVNNLKRKYTLIYKKEYTGEIYFEIDNLLEMRGKFIRIKEGGVRGQEYSLWVQADKDMQKIIYYLGLGQNSSTGCGCLSYVTGVNESA